MYSFLQARIAGVHEGAVAAASGSASEEFSYTGAAADAAVSGAASAWPWATIEQQQEREENQKWIDAEEKKMSAEFDWREVQIAVRAYSIDLRDIQIVVLLMILLSSLAS